MTNHYHRPERHDRKSGWGHSHNWTQKVRGRRERLGRNNQVGSSDRYSYALGLNFVVLSGKVVRAPLAAGIKGREWVWFRIAVPNQDRRNQWLFMPIRTAGRLAFYTFANVNVGDVVCVQGRIYSARMPIQEPDGRTIWKQFTYMIAEQVSPSCPVALDRDPRFVRVRVDLFNRLCSLSEEMHPHRIPIDKRADLGLGETLLPPGYSEAHFSTATDLGATDLTNLDHEDEKHDEDHSGGGDGSGGSDGPADVPERGEEQ